MKCMVKSCNNHDHQGTFVGVVCTPCLEYTFAVKSNKEHTKCWYFTEGVMPDIREQLEDIISNVASSPNSPVNAVLDKLKGKYL